MNNGPRSTRFHMKATYNFRIGAFGLTQKYVKHRVYRLSLVNKDDTLNPDRELKLHIKICNLKICRLFSTQLFPNWSEQKTV